MFEIRNHTIKKRNQANNISILNLIKKWIVTLTQKIL